MNYRDEIEKIAKSKNRDIETDTKVRYGRDVIKPNAKRSLAAGAISAIPAATAFGLVNGLKHKPKAPGTVFNTMEKARKYTASEKVIKAHGLLDKKIAKGTLMAAPLIFAASKLALSDKALRKGSEKYLGREATKEERQLNAVAPLAQSLIRNKAKGLSPVANSVAGSAASALTPEVMIQLRRKALEKKDKK